MQCKSTERHDAKQQIKFRGLGIKGLGIRGLGIRDLGLGV